MKQLHISNDLSLPLEAVTNTHLIVARRRVGKSYTAAANRQQAPITTDELQRAILSRLPRPRARLLEILIDHYPNPVNREELARLAGQSFTSSGYTNNLGGLRSLGVIDYPSSTEAVALPVLFLE